MNWKFWKDRTPTPTARNVPRLILRGMSDSELREAFLTSPDSAVFAGVLEQCDKQLMEGVNGLVNEAEQLTDGQLRQRVGELRGFTELREQLTLREQQAREDQQRLKEPEGENNED